MIVGLLMILILVLLLPFTIQMVERNLETFLFFMGLAAALISDVLNKDLYIQALEAPIYISLVVLIAGLLFKWLQSPIEKGVLRMTAFVPIRIFLAVTVFILGILSSFITAIIAAITLVMIASILKLDRPSEIRFVVLACFSIGLGAALTPIGEPLSTITISKLDTHFFYLLQLIGPTVIPALLMFSVLTAVFIQPNKNNQKSSMPLPKESYTEIFIRSFKIYLFIMGLTLLGAGFEPLIETYLIGLSPLLLYWVNMISAVLDNATLAAAEISPIMDDSTIQAILLGLLISGGMLIPGNIPNMIAAGKLNITSREWAQFGLPIGLSTMAIYFIIILI